MVVLISYDNIGSLQTVGGNLIRGGALDWQIMVNEPNLSGRWDNTIYGLLRVQFELYALYISGPTNNQKDGAEVFPQFPIQKQKLFTTLWIYKVVFSQMAALPICSIIKTKAPSFRSARQFFITVPRNNQKDDSEVFSTMFSPVACPFYPAFIVKVILG